MSNNFMGREYQQSAAYKANHPKFAQADTKNRTWNKFGDAAENERAIMVAEFHTWCVKTRCNTEVELINAAHYQHEIAPFAQAAFDASAY